MVRVPCTVGKSLSALLLYRKTYLKKEFSDPKSELL